MRITNPAINADHSAAARVNFTADSGVGVGVTQATDHLLVKAILGYRFNNKNN